MSHCQLPQNAGLRCIPLEEYEELIHDQCVLQACINLGVHNWEGWELVADEVQRLKALGNSPESTSEKAP